MHLIRSYYQNYENKRAEEGQGPKKVKPLEWGLDLLKIDHIGGDPFAILESYSHEHLSKSILFYRPPPLGDDFDLKDGTDLSFSSPMQTPEEKNNTVYAKFFPKSRNAVVLIPHWNSVMDDYITMAKMLTMAGMSVLLVTLPYHDQRMPDSMEYAEYMFSTNLGRTVRSVRQAVWDTKKAMKFLINHYGVDKIFLVGMSLGAHIAHITAAHDTNVDALALGMIGNTFANLAWSGLATTHIRKGLAPDLSLVELQSLWALIAPESFVVNFRKRYIPTLFMQARYDLVVKEELFTHLIGSYNKIGVSYNHEVYHCGHYSMGKFPHSIIVLKDIITFLRRYF